MQARSRFPKRNEALAWGKGMSPSGGEASSCSLRNDGFRPDSGPCRGGSCRLALRPSETLPAAATDDHPRPCVDGSPLARGFWAALQRWLVRPCVRPICAAHSVADHNAIRVSGPDQKLALKVLGRNVVFLIRRFQPACCINSRLPFPSSSAWLQPRFVSNAMSLCRCRHGRLNGLWISIAFAAGHQCPHRSGCLVGERDSRNLRWTAAH